MKVGIYNRHLATLGGGERYSLAIADVLSRTHDVTVLSHAAVDAAAIAGRLGLDLGHVAFAVAPSSRPDRLSAMTAAYDLFINGSNWDFFPALAPHSALIVYFPLEPSPGTLAQLRYQAGRALNLPGLRRAHALLSRVGLTDVRTRLENLIPPNFLDHVRTYEQCWTISAYVQQWTATYWGMESELLYPAVAVDQFAPGDKAQRILSVGRFFAGNHNKKHMAMIAAFRALVEGGLRGWELHLAGGVNAGAQHAAYLAQVRAAAGGLPIVLHPDLPFQDLQALYAGSALYWHASGYGEDVQQAPRKFEHFGITTVEAMAAGCVPVVIGQGGQPELVRHGENGFLWRTLDELQGYTLELIRDPTRRRAMGQRAVMASRRFDQRHFEARLHDLIEQVH